jgi:heme A synthase
LLIVQVSLGGLHVLNELPAWTGLVHTAVAMALAGLLAVLVGVTRPGLFQMRGRALTWARRSDLPLLTWLTAAACYILLLTGSLVTRTGASLACPAFPHCGMAGVTADLQSYVTIQLVHRFTAFAVGIMALLVAYRLHEAGLKDRALRAFAWVIAGLVVLQFSLGIANVLLKIPMWSRVLHLGTGGTLFVILVILATTLHLARRPEAQPEPFVASSTP